MSTIRDDAMKLCVDLKIRCMFDDRFGGQVQIMRTIDEVPEFLARALADRGWTFDEYGQVYTHDSRL